MGRMTSVPKLHSPRRVFSIRYKVLLLLTLIPVVVLALYLFMALRVFSDDKIAYVYDSASSISRSLGNQVNIQLAGLLTSSRPLLQEFTLNQNFGTISEALIKTDDRLVWVAAFTAENGGFERRGLVEAKEKALEGTLRELGGPDALNAILREALGAERVVKVPFKDDRALLIEKVEDKANNRTIVFALLYRLGDVANDFRVPTQFANYLVGPDGKILLAPSGVKEEQIKAIAPLKFIERKDGANSGTEEVLAKSGVPMIAAFARTGMGQLWTVTFVSKKDALSAVDTLIWKSVFFFFVLICGTIIISLVASSSLTGSLSDLFAATRRVAEGDFDIRVRVNSSDEVGSLADSFNAMAEEVSRLLKETAEKSRMESELKTAQTVQETLFPADYSEAMGTTVVGNYEPASECGGDWWFHSVINGRLFLWMGDATGHGAPAALITSAARSASSILEGLDIGPGLALELMNRAIYDVSKGKIMMTFFVAAYDPRTGKLAYANASHEAPFLIRRGDEPPKKRDLIPLNDVNNPRLGQDRGSKYEEAEVDLAPGDRILVYTDGVTDLRNAADEALGERNFIKLILEANKNYAPVGDVMAFMRGRLREHRGSTPLVDDVTYFMMQVKDS